MDEKLYLSPETAAALSVAIDNQAAAFKKLDTASSAAADAATNNIRLKLDAETAIALHLAVELIRAGQDPFGGAITPAAKPSLRQRLLARWRRR